MQMMHCSLRLDTTIKADFLTPKRLKLRLNYLKSQPTSHINMCYHCSITWLTRSIHHKWGLFRTGPDAKSIWLPQVDAIPGDAEALDMVVGANEAIEVVDTVRIA
jgi:hypothetical protein